MRDISFHSDFFQRSYASEKIKLLPKVYELFQLLYQYPAHKFSRQALLDLIWSMSDPVVRTVDDRLRKKLATISDVVTIRTVRGQGDALRLMLENQSVFGGIYLCNKLGEFIS